MEAFLWVLLICLTGVQLCYIVLSRRSKNTLSNTNIAENEIGDILSDLDLQARRGQILDLATYQDRLDRKLDPYLDKIRQFAGAALATGIGGTMLIFAFEIKPLIDLVTDNSTEGIIWLVLPAVLSSIIGILVHLCLVFFVLQPAQRSVDEEVKKLSQQVRQRFQDLPFQSGFGESFQKELTQAFSEALKELPEVFETVQLEAKRLIDLADKQLSEVASKLDKVSVVYEGLTVAGRKIASSMEDLEELTKPLNELPEQIAESLERSVRDWKRELSEVQGGFRESVDATFSEQRGLLQKIQANSEAEKAHIQSMFDESHERQKVLMEKFEALSTLLEKLPEEHRKALDGFDEKFGIKAENHVHEFKDVLSDNMNKLQTILADAQRRIHSEFVSDTGVIVKEIFDGLRKEIDATITGPLTTVNDNFKETSDSLKNAASEIPVAAKEFSDSLKASSESLENIPERLDKATDNIEESVQNMQGVLQSIMESLQSITKSLQSITKAWKPIRVYTQQFYGRMQKTIDGLVQRLKKLMRRN